MHRLLQGIEAEEPHRRLNGALRARGLALMGQQPRQGLQRLLPQPLPLGHEPLLEERLVQREAEEQIAAVQLGRLLQRLRSPLGNAPLEGHHVDLHRHGVHGHGLPFDPQRWRVGVGERPAQRDERVAETTTRLIVALLAPQQGRELVAGVALAGSNGKIGQQGLSLLRR